MNQSFFIIVIFIDYGILENCTSDFEVKLHCYNEINLFVTKK